MTLSSLRSRLGASIAWLADQPHRRALSTVLAFLIAHFSAKWSGIDSDTVDAGLGLILSALAAAWAPKVA